jgi:hypothetical protein
MDFYGRRTAPSAVRFKLRPFHGMHRCRQYHDMEVLKPKYHGSEILAAIPLSHQT